MRKLACGVTAHSGTPSGLGSTCYFFPWLSDAISDELWTAKSADLQDELRRVRTEMERHEGASQAYETAALQIPELAQPSIPSMLREIRANRLVW